MDELLFRLIAEGVGRYLDAVDRLAEPERSKIAVETRRLVAAWRAVLALHNGCHGCRRRGACSVWRVAEAYFVRRISSRRRAR
ncbi:hypothetical protein [Actinophytocola gossypii]|uniref:Uncharacterized protein n=1 Tax=Actinophytocola gossypii TaxID=2812003 RepID=A0ABT2JLG5_9PSEU|nr:hypothetical protein [Actinophytocola gossypii]MCT2588129.1 hypothetical protein [Actinophytocola gossypii]